LRGGYFTFKTNYLNPFPLPEPPLSISDCAIAISNYLMNIEGKDNIVSKFFDSLANAISYELYFPEEFKQAGCEIIKHLGNLPEITDTMSDTEKQKIIDKIFATLYDKNHPVRKNLEKMEQEVEEVRIIKESLGNKDNPTP
jgi:CO dehydrogenase/acetyl-CoA synthase beta subunit